MNLKVARRWFPVTNLHAIKFPIVFHAVGNGDETSNLVNVGGEGSVLVKGAVGNTKLEWGCEGASV